MNMIESRVGDESREYRWNERLEADSLGVDGVLAGIDNLGDRIHLVVEQSCGARGSIAGKWVRASAFALHLQSLYLDDLAAEAFVSNRRIVGQRLIDRNHRPRGTLAAIA